MKIIRLSDLAPKLFKANNAKIVEGIGGKANKTVKILSKSKKLKNEKSGNLTRARNIRAIGEPLFPNSDAGKAFNLLR